ncbi:MAG: glycoside hydrolase family 127 protein [Propionicimonas sp.]
MSKVIEQAVTDVPAGVPVAPVAGALIPLSLNAVRIDGGFWAERQRVNAAISIPHSESWERRCGWLENFRLAAEGSTAPRGGREFSDSDVYKLLEAMAWEVARTGDPALDARIDEIAVEIQHAQRADGYLNTHFDGPGQPARYTDFEWGHELYCYGHLFQAAVARLRSGRRGTLVEVALRAADHVCRTFGDEGVEAICGHPEIEVALAELYRAVGEPAYLEQARRFVERRGRGLLGEIEFGAEYFQDDEPVREATIFRGHAVRAGYLAAGAIDVAVETGDDQLLSAVKAQYDRTLARRTYLTGGIGSRHFGEAFGEDFELPPDQAYCETCAAVSSVMVAWRLLLATGDERYADVIERTLYNAIAVSPSERGDAFFYANPLQKRTPGHPSDPDRICPRASSQLRAPWFTVSCCPTNVARVFASLSALWATVDGPTLRLHQFAPGIIDAHLADGRPVTLQVRTGYPYDGRIEIEVLRAPVGQWELAVRVPAWAVTAEFTGLERDGRLARARGLEAGDLVVMELGLEPRLVLPDARIDAVRGCVAIERGPFVLCLESIDLPDAAPVDDFVLDAAVPPVSAGDGAEVAGWLLRPEPADWPYRNAGGSGEPVVPAQARLVPYHRWGNRGPSTMRVWLPARG